MIAPSAWTTLPRDHYESRIHSLTRFADCHVARDYHDGWSAEVVIPRADGSTQPPAERHVAHRLPSREAAQAWCERVAAQAFAAMGGET